MKGVMKRKNDDYCSSSRGLDMEVIGRLVEEIELESANSPKYDFGTPVHVIRHQCKYGKLLTHLLRTDWWSQEIDIIITTNNIVYVPNIVTDVWEPDPFFGDNSYSRGYIVAEPYRTYLLGRKWDVLRSTLGFSI